MHDCYEFNDRKKNALYKYIKKILRERIRIKKSQEIDNYITELIEIEKEIGNVIGET